jgi:hypothetical protein
MRRWETSAVIHDLEQLKIAEAVSMEGIVGRPSLQLQRVREDD